MRTDDFAKSNIWVPIENSKVDTKIQLRKDTSLNTIKTQYPFMLSWTSTVYTFQGHNLPEVVISFDLLKSKHLIMVGCMQHLADLLP